MLSKLEHALSTKKKHSFNIRVKHSKVIDDFIHKLWELFLLLVNTYSNLTFDYIICTIQPLAPNWAPRPIIIMFEVYVFVYIFVFVIVYFWDKEACGHLASFSFRQIDRRYIVMITPPTTPISYGYLPVPVDQGHLKPKKRMRKSSVNV